MAFLFARNKQKVGSELVLSTREPLQRLRNNAAAGTPSGKRTDSKMEEDLAQKIAQMKTILQGTPESPPNPEQAELLKASLIADDLLLPLVQGLHLLPFESRKDTQMIFSRLFQATKDRPVPPILEHVVTRQPEIITALCNGYDIRESALPCGGILRDALKYDAIAALILYDDPEQHRPEGLKSVDVSIPSSGKGLFWKFFDWISKCPFEISADAFSTFREILTHHKSLVAHYLDVNFDRFFSVYHKTLVLPESYVTKRQSIKLLSELLLDRANYNVMTRYVDSDENLKISMILLLDRRRMVSYEGFHVFKVFVANPNKSEPVKRMLQRNSDKLLNFLPGFLSDRSDDDQFHDEKSFLIREIEKLTPARQQASGTLLYA